jgi:hypothetical protein
MQQEHRPIDIVQLLFSLATKINISADAKISPNYYSFKYVWAARSHLTCLYKKQQFFSFILICEITPVPKIT